jgi:hypothetical protein
MSAGAPARILQALLFLLAGCAGSPAAAQSNAAPNLPASLRPLIPRGWVATSFAEVDLNKDGTMDRAVLLAPMQTDEPQLGPIQGTPLRDRCRNLLLLIGQPAGGAPEAAYLPWSKHTATLDQQPNSTDWTATCLGATSALEVPEEAPWSSPLAVIDSLSAVKNTLRYVVGTQTEDYWKTLVIRIEQDCLRLIGSENTHVGGDDTHDSENTSINYLTRKRIDESDTQLETLDRNGEYKREKRSATTTISQTAPICLNDRPLLLSPATPAPQQPPPKLPTRAAEPPTAQAASPSMAPPPASNTPGVAPTTNAPPRSMPTPPAARPSSPTPKPAPMTVEELWRNPPPGSRISWARWSDGKEESYIRLRDGTLYDRPGITVWSARGPLTLSKALHEQDATDLAACPDSVEEALSSDRYSDDCRGDATWETWSAIDASGRVVWTIGDGPEALEEFSYESRSLELLSSDSRGLLFDSYLDGNYAGAHGVEERKVWWADTAAGTDICRSWPAGAADAVETSYRSRTDSSVGDSDCEDLSYFDCMESNRLFPGEPLKPVFFGPHPTCGRIREWDWTSELSLPWVARALGEWQSATNAIAPTDIEPNPIVDCTYRPGFDGPSAVGWSAIVR